MSDKVLIPLPGLGTLSLSREAFHAALEEGSRAIPASITAAPAQAAEPVLDAEQLAAALSLPVTWVEQAAREQRIPSLHAGRWRRFKRSAVERALSSAEGAAA
jgi:excisionase family DNA binding protein